MNNGILLSDLDLAALLCSRVCHDIVSPVGAIANGLEVLEDEDSAEMRDVALNLIRSSVNQASHKLQFCRMAFGASGSAGAMLDLAEAEQISRRFIGNEKVVLTWAGPAELRPKAQVKILLNLLLIALSTLPRGGTLDVSIDGSAFTLAAGGTGARIPEKTAAMLDGGVHVDDIDPRLAQIYYTIRLAEDARYQIVIRPEENRVLIEATEAATATAQ